MTMVFMASHINYLPAAEPGDCCPSPRRKADLREVINALRYLVRSGCGWRMLPEDFPAWQTVYWWFRRLLILV